ncbi:MAG: transcriptional regulator GcvA [Rhodospirillales bacterium]|nr:transcriptional regulator GcvA [Rhodospirillales bacterium]
MYRRLPPLNSLRSFEAAARHLSFTKAAAELNVTPAAVSHQVKALEDLVGGPLFKRLTRALKLTDRGRAALPLLSEGLDRLEEGARLMGTAREKNVLIVTTAPTFAARWLVPRLDSFQRAHPDINIRIDATVAAIDLRRDEVDVAIRFGSGDYPGYRVDLLFNEEVFPVCSPSLLAGVTDLTPNDLSKFTLLHTSFATSTGFRVDWRMWLKTVGAMNVDWQRGPVFSSDTLTVQAALMGQGVALPNGAAVRDDLKAGRLIRPFDLSIESDFAYYLLTPLETTDDPAIDAFREWILGEVCS